MTFYKFLEKIRVVNPRLQERMPISLYPSQQEIVDLIDQNDTYNVIYKRRQEGVSTVISLYVIWRMIETPGLSVAIFSNTIDCVTLRRMLSYNTYFNLKSERKNYTTLENNSSVYYYSFNTTNNYRIRGKIFDIIIMEDFFDNFRFRDNFSNAENFILQSSLNLPINGKVIISTSEITNDEKNKLNKLISNQEIYGGFFNGKRKVLIEKYKSRTNYFEL